MTLFGASRLSEVHPDLIRLVTAVSAVTDVQVVQGARTLAAEEIAIWERTSALKDPRASKHVLTSERTLAHALDVAPWPVHWANIPAFVSLATLVLATASALSIEIEWGGSWRHLKDYDHFELL